jgi:FkbM family methyltransferase
MKAVKLVQKSLRSLGYEVVPYPPSDWVRSRDSLRRVLNKLSIDCVFDVGANHSQFGNRLRDIGFEGWIVSFEPVRSAFEDLSKCAAARPPWRVFQYALGSKDGQAEINVSETDELTSFFTSLGPTKTLPGNRVVRRETVELRRLDSIFDECVAGAAARRYYLKLDTQGYDLEVLRGADGVLDKILGAQTEVSFVPIYKDMPGYLESLKEFESRGFSVVDFMPVTRAAEDDLVMIEMDCILARRSESA